MSTNLVPQNIAYSLNQPLSAIFNPPFVANRAPTINDAASIGQIWVYPAANGPYILTSITGNAQYNWQLLEAGGGAGVFANLTVNPGPTNLTGAFTLHTNGSVANIGTDASNDTINIGTAGARTLNIGNNNGLTDFQIIGGAASTITVVNDPLTIVTGTGNLNIANDATAQNINIGTGLGAKIVTVGSVSGASSIELDSGTGSARLASNATDHTTFLGSTTGVSATNLQSGTGGIITAAPFVRLNGTVNIYVGAGVPANGLALETGDLYINSTAATAVTRLYISTGAGAWTNFTASA
jgi:hypothetical protein